MSNPKKEGYVESLQCYVDETRCLSCMLFHFESYLPAWDYKRLEMISQDCKCDDVVLAESKGSVSEESATCKSQLPVKH